MYNFTTFAMQLNEPEDDVGPTDSRLRPDQRLMEDGLWDEANQEKHRLEEKQRVRRRQDELLNKSRADQGQPALEYEPVWFKMSADIVTGDCVHQYRGTNEPERDYWRCKEIKNWPAECSDIF